MGESRKDNPDWGALAQGWLDRLAGCSEPGAGVTRLPFTPEHRAALDILTELMEEAGMVCGLDAAGTLIGRLQGAQDAPVLMMGSHQDSVRAGGGYDGIMGVVLPVLAVMKLRHEGSTPPVSLEILAFADEEGVRFPTALMGPRALAGSFDVASLDLCDGEGISLRDAMTGFGLDPDALPQLKRDPEKILGWIECHLEQGPVLEKEGLTLGAVTAICGIERHNVILRGRAAHAGTVPMEHRRDALTASAEMILATERHAGKKTGVLATIGRHETRPGAVNVIPGEVAFTLEIRAASDAARKEAATGIIGEIGQIAKTRGIAIQTEQTYAQNAAVCNPDMTELLCAAIGEVTGAHKMMPSGATHDTSAMVDLCPAAMLFTACSDGISHHPDEKVSQSAMSDAITTLAVFIKNLRNKNPFPEK